jgi:hypothetical protein
MQDWQKPFVEWRGDLKDNAVWRELDLAKIAVERVIDRTPGAPRGLIICGAGGSGKDYLVEQMLNKRHLPILYLDVSSEAALVKFAYRHRNARVVLVSDNGKLLRQEAMIDRLKHLIDPGYLHYETEEVVTNSKRPTPAEHAWMILSAQTPQERARIERMALRDETMPEPEFATNFSLIWTSNVNYTDESAIPPALRPHWGALKSRGINPRYIPDKPRDLFTYSLHLVLECSMLRGLHCKLEDANAVLATFIQQRGYLADVSPRFVRDLARLRSDLRNSNRLGYWEQQTKSLLATRIVNPTLASLTTPVFQIPSPYSSQ